MFAGIICLSTGMFAMVACNNNDSTPVPMNGFVDVVIQDVKADVGVKYGIYIYAYSNYEIKSVKVTAPGTGGKVYQLTATSDKHQFMFIPGTTDLTDQLPVKGDYSYEVISVDNDKITGKDVVGDEKLAAITIKTATMSTQLLKTTWDKVSGADAYVVKLYSADKTKTLFASSLLASDKVEYQFGSSTTGWATGVSPVANTNYVVELLGVKFETGVTIDKGINIQFITLDSKTIKWE
jgi:hypothetical protein